MRTSLKLKQAASLAGLAVPVACLAVISGCATYESYPEPVAASASLPTPATLQDYRAVRASELIGKAVRNQNGEYLGQLQDLVVQMGNGMVRYAVVDAGAGDQRVYVLPMHALRSGTGNEMVIDLARPRLADHRSFTSWPSMQDIAYWNELDRMSGFPAVQPGHGYDRLSNLRGKLVVGANGEHLGRVEDFVVNASSDVVHYAIIGLEPGRAGGGRLVAVPLHAFAYPREGVNRLALDIDATQLAQLETFDAARWAQLNDPTYVAHIDRYFVTAFPSRTGVLFDDLDTNRDGFLSRAELAPLQMAGTDRYLVRGPARQESQFHRLDRDGDGFLTRTEAAPLGIDFARYDTNADGFLSLAEAAPLFGAVSPGQAAGLSFDQLDRDRDGFVNRAEATALIPSAGVVTQQIVVTPVVSFEALDVDRDGFLNRMEASTLLDRTGGIAAFDRYDTNRDGFLSRSELDLLLRQQNVGGTSAPPVQGSFGNR